MFNFISIVDNHVRIRGFNAKPLLADIAKMMQNTRITNWMFKPITYGVEFNQFYLPDVFFLLQKLYDQTKSPAYRYKLSNLMGDLKSKTWLANVDKKLPDILDLNKDKDFTRSSLPHQVEFLKYYNSTVPSLNLKGALLAAAPGSSKTATGLLLGHCLDADRVIIISPLNAVIRVWEAEIKLNFKKPQSYWLSTNNKPLTNERFVVYHYEALEKALNDISNHMKFTKVVVILDECHNLNEIKSLRTQRFIQLVKETHTKHTLFMSGTPTKAISSELIPLLKCIDPYFDDESELIFKKIFNENAKLNNEIVKARLGQISFKVEKSELKLDKPNMIEVKVKSPNSKEFTLKAIAKVIEIFIKERTEYYKARRPDDIKQYDRCIEVYLQSIKHNNIAVKELDEYHRHVKIIQKAHDNGGLREVIDVMELANKFENSRVLPALTPDLKKVFKEVKTIVKYTKLKIQGECLGRILGRARIDCHVDMVSGIDFKTIIDESLKKTVIFTSYTEVCEATLNKLSTLDYNALGVYGKFTKQLSEVVSKFEKDDTINPLVATYASLSTAVPLVMANTVIMINAPFRAYIQEQAISRVHRLGATTPVFIYQCVLDTGEEPNISTRGINILEWSQSAVEDITGVINPYKDKDIIIEGDMMSIANESLDIETLVDIKSLVQQSKMKEW